MTGAMYQTAALLENLEALCLATQETDEIDDFKCPRFWDGLLCWPPAAANSTSQLPCPSYVGFSAQAMATRHCTENGTWYFNELANRTWTNYTACSLPFSTTLLETWLPVIRRISQVGYGVSLGTLLIALGILASFKKLYCPRNTLHMHLFISFIMRAFMALLRDNLFVDGLDELVLETPESLPESSAELQSPAVSSGIGWQCKLVTSLWQYFIMANYSWILMEGLYLHNLIFMALFTDSSAITIYIILGWGLPLFFVTCWVLCRAFLDNIFCWTTNDNRYIFWALIRGPITASILVNLVFFIHIAWVLLSKLRSSVSAETRKYRYRKWAKSTLVLVPLFGVHYTVYCVMHGVSGLKEGVELALLFSDQLFASFQGFLVAVLYCLLNGEVRCELSRRWKRFRQNHHLESPWSQYSVTNNSRTNTTRWRTSFQSVQASSVGDRRFDLRMRSLTPPLLASLNSNTSCPMNGENGSQSSSNSASSLHQLSNGSGSNTSTRLTCPKPGAAGVNRLEKIVSESEDSEYVDNRSQNIALNPPDRNQYSTVLHVSETIPLTDLSETPKLIAKTSL